MIFVLPLLLACVSEDAQILQSWEGTYKTQRLSMAESSCDEGPDIDIDPRFFEIDTAIGEGAHLVAIRECGSATDCPGLPWFEGVVIGPKDKHLEGDLGDFSFGGPDVNCSVQWVGLSLSRAGADADGVTIEIEIHTETDSVETQQACLDILDAVPFDEDCDSFYVLEGKRTP